ncbi:hypothetical protein BH10BAC5_BH10BAC5_22880 [soil metagenome]
MGKNLNYNKDSVKHYVRYHGWKESYKKIKNHVEREIEKDRRTERCKYLTFCAIQAIDVFMLEMENYIYRDEETNRLTNVFFCENEEESFSLINKMLGSEGQGFYGDFKDIVLQKLDEPIEESDDPFDEPSSEVGREQLRLIEVKKNLLKVFPFDVINLDFYGNFFPATQGRFSESCQTYNEVLKLQKVENGHLCKRFLMFLTVYTPVLEDQINDNALKQLALTLNQNMGYGKFRDAFKEKFNLDNPNDLELYMIFVLGFTKQIIFKESYVLGWQPNLKEIYCYDRHNEGTDTPYKISTFVVEFKRNADLEKLDFSGAIPDIVEDDYLEQLNNIIMNKPHNVPVEDEIPETIKKDLADIVEFRNKFLKNIGIFDEENFT